MHTKPATTKLHRTVQFIKDREDICLTSDQPRSIYKKVEMDSLVNVEAIKQEKEEDRLDNNNDNEADNLYQNIIINDFDRINVNVNISKIEQSSVLSNVINYVQYNRNLRDYYKLDVKASEPNIRGKYKTG